MMGFTTSNPELNNLKLQITQLTLDKFFYSTFVHVLLEYREDTFYITMSMFMTNL